MIFTTEMHWKWILLWKCIGNDFYYKNALEMIFTIKMHCILFSLFGLLSSSLSPCLSQRFSRCTLRISSGGWNVELSPFLAHWAKDEDNSPKNVNNVHNTSSQKYRQKWIGNDFYYKHAVEIIFIINIHQKWFLL